MSQKGLDISPGNFEPHAYLGALPKELVLWYTFLKRMQIEPFASAKLEPKTLWSALDVKNRQWVSAFEYYNNLQFHIKL